MAARPVASNVRRRMVTLRWFMRNLAIFLPGGFRKPRCPPGRRGPGRPRCRRRPRPARRRHQSPQAPSLDAGSQRQGRPTGVSTRAWRQRWASTRSGGGAPVKSRNSASRARLTCSAPSSRCARLHSGLALRVQASGSVAWPGRDPSRAAHAIGPGLSASTSAPATRAANRAITAQHGAITARPAMAANGWAAVANRLAAWLAGSASSTASCGEVISPPEAAVPPGLMSAAARWRTAQPGCAKCRKAAWRPVRSTAPSAIARSAIAAGRADMPGMKVMRRPSPPAASQGAAWPVVRRSSSNAPKSAPREVANCAP